MKRQNVRTLSLIVSTFVYLLCGAAIFEKLEARFEYNEKIKLQQTESELRQRYNISDSDFEILQNVILWSKPYKSGIQWKFAGAFYFSLSVITTIGELLVPPPPIHAF